MAGLGKLIKYAAALAAAAGALTASYAHELPAAAGWNHTLLPLTNLQSNWSADGLRTGTCGFTAKTTFARFSQAEAAPQRIFYVRANGNDAADGTGWATSVQSIWKAIQLRNAYPTETAKIYVDGSVNGGIFDRALAFSQGGTQFIPAFDTAFVAINGRIRCGSFQFLGTFTQDGTFTNTWSIARSSVDGVLDVSKRLPNLGFPELTYLPTAAAANIRPNSWAPNGGNLNINRDDGAQPATGMATTPNVMVKLNSPHINWTGTPVNLYFGGDKSGDGFDFFGGSGSGPAVFNYTARPGTPKCHVFESCTFNYAGGPSSNYAGRGLTIESLDGLCACFNCGGIGNSTDTFNYHYQNAGAAGGTLYAYNQNCWSDDIGRGTGQSCNPFTLHEAVVGVDLCGRYTRSAGGLRNINTSRFVALATHVGQDRGDIHLGGGVFPVAFRVDDTAQIWTDMVTTDMSPSGYDFWATSSATIRHRRLINPNSRFGGTGQPNGEW